MIGKIRTSIRSSETEIDWKNKNIQHQPKFRRSNKKKNVYSVVYHIESGCFMDVCYSLHAENVHNFERKDETQVDTLSTKYDFKSIMHYGKYSFAINGKQY